MVKHIIIWQMKDGLSEDESRNIRQEIKQKLEALVGVIDGLEEVRVTADVMDTSNAELLLG